MDPLRVIMLVIHALLSVVLVALVVSQNHRSEGLGAMGGGSSGPTMRGRAGFEEQLSNWTRYVAIAFMAVSVLLYFFTQKFGWS